MKQTRFFKRLTTAKMLSNLFKVVGNGPKKSMDSSLQRVEGGGKGNNNLGVRLAAARAFWHSLHCAKNDLMVDVIFGQKNDCRRMLIIAA